VFGESSTRGEMRNAYTILVAKPKGKKPLGRHRYRRDDNIKMDIKTVELYLESFLFSRNVW
jgi:hypothetical protein